MRTFLLLSAACLTSSIVTFAEPGTGSALDIPTTLPDLKQRLTGNWRLLSFENFDEKGAARPGGYSAGRLMYDAHGNMAAQLTREGRKPLASTPTDRERAEAYAGFLSYYGRYAVDESKGVVTHHVEGSTNPNWVNTTLTRWYAFSHDDTRLMLSLHNDQGRVTGTLTWERMQ